MYTKDEQSPTIEMLNGIILYQINLSGQSAYELDLSVNADTPKIELLNINKPLRITGPLNKKVEVGISTTSSVEFTGDILGTFSVNNKGQHLILNIQGSLKSYAALKVVGNGSIKLKGNVEKHVKFVAKECVVNISGTHESSIECKSLEQPKQELKPPPRPSMPTKSKPLFQTTNGKTSQSPLMKKLQKQVVSQHSMFSFTPPTSSLLPPSLPNKNNTQLQKEVPAKNKHRGIIQVDAATVENEKLNDKAKKAFDHELKKYSNVEISTAERNAVDLAAESFKSSRRKISERLSHFVTFVEKNKSINFANNGKFLALKEPQVNALRAMNSFLLKRNAEKDEDKNKLKYNGYFHCATRFGKSIVMTALCMIFNGRDKFDFPILIVVPRLLLKDQFIDELRKYVPDVAIRIFDGTEKILDKRAITVTTYASFQSQMEKKYEERQLRVEDFSAVLLDEAHHALAAGIHQFVRRYFHVLVLGFTATKEYNTKRENGALYSLDQLFDECIFEYTIRQGIKDGLLSPCMNVIVNVEADHVIKQRLNRARKKDYSQQDMAHLKQQKHNRIAVDIHHRFLIKETREPLFIKQGIVFAIDRSQAYEIHCEFQKEFKEHPYFIENDLIPSAYIGSDLSKSECEAILDNFDKGKIQYICNSDYLLEGYTSNSRTVTDMRPTMSRLLEQQRNGRILKIGDGPSIIIELNYGIPQVFFKEFLGGRSVYGPIRKSKKDVPNYTVEQLSNVANYTIQDELLIPNPNVVKETKQTKQTTYSTISFTLEAFEEVPDYLSDLNDIPELIHTDVMQASSDITTDSRGMKREFVSLETQHGASFSVFKKLKETVEKEDFQIENTYNY